MTDPNSLFTPESPCRCGYDGTGFHRCHAGRPDPHTGEDGSRWCEKEAQPRLLATPSCLAGAQLKVGAVVVCYCDEHYAQFKEESP